MKSHIKNSVKVGISIFATSLLIGATSNTIDAYPNMIMEASSKSENNLIETNINENASEIEANIEQETTKQEISFLYTITDEDKDCFVNIYKENEIYSIDTRLYDKNTNLYYHIYNNDGNISKPIILAFHGSGASPGCLNNFSIYRWIENGTINPDAIVIVIEKPNSGSWKNISNNVGILIDKIMKEHEYKGNVGYIGFSQGVFDANTLINSTKNTTFKSAMFVDGLPEINEDCCNLESLYIIGAYYNKDNSVEKLNDTILSYNYFDESNYKYDNIYNVVISPNLALNSHSFVQAYALAENEEMLYSDTLYYQSGYVNQTFEYGNGLEWLIKHLQ